MAESQSPAPSFRGWNSGLVNYWARKCASTVLDQGLISGSNFILSIMLARWIGPEQYGVYAIFYAVFLLVANFHQALLLEPMSVYVPSEYADRKREYLGAVIRLHLWVCGGFMAALTALLAGAVVYTGDRSLLPAAAGLVLALPSVLLLWLSRAGAYLGTESGRAAGGSFIYASVLLPGTAALYWSGQLSLVTAFSLMGIASLVSSLFILRHLRPVFSGSQRLAPRALLSNHWSYGSWSLATAGVTWLQNYGFFLYTGLLLGRRETGILNALLNLGLPVTHVLMASFRLFLPYLSGLSARSGRQATRNTVRLLSAAFVVIAVAYWIFLLAFRGSLNQVVHGPKFAEFGWMAPWANLYLIFWAAMFAFELGLRALKSPSQAFLVITGAAAVSLVLGAALVPQHQLLGVFAALAVSSLAGLILAMKLFQVRTGELPARVTAQDGAAETCAVEGASR